MSATLKWIVRLMESLTRRQPRGNVEFEFEYMSRHSSSLRNSMTSKLLARILSWSSFGRVEPPSSSYNSRTRRSCKNARGNKQYAFSQVMKLRNRAREEVRSEL